MPTDHQEQVSTETADQSVSLGGPRDQRLSFQTLKAQDPGRLLRMLPDTRKQGLRTDRRLWFPKSDRAGNTEGRIRQLPSPLVDVCPIVDVWTHYFNYNRRYFEEFTPTPIDHPCPVCEALA